MEIFLQEGLLMRDDLGRNIDYIRISVTDRCNLRCVYCMPAEGIEPIPQSEILTDNEIIRLCRVFADMGIRKVKITGGEPLVRPDLADLIKQIKSIGGIENVTLTTNGIFLKEQLPLLVDAGLDAVNISVDTLNDEKYKRITGHDELENVLDAVYEALKYPRLRVKINCVPMSDSGIADIIEIAGLAKKTSLIVRFIEMMPIGYGREFEYYSEDEIKRILESAYGKFEAVSLKTGNGPAHYFSVPDFEGLVGFISAMSHQFCSECNRVRMTCDGMLKTCLHYSGGINLKSILRAGKSDAILKETIEEAILSKPKSHNFNGNKVNVESDKYEQRNMSKIGG